MEEQDKEQDKEQNKEQNITEVEIFDVLTDADEQLSHLFDAERWAEMAEEDTSFGGKVHSFIHSFCVPVLIGLLAALILTQVIFFHAVVPSGSMETTIMTGDRLVGSRMYLWFNEPQHGDVMIFWSDEYNEFLVKRVIGCPGDLVEIRSDGVYVNGELISDEYTQGTTEPLRAGISVWYVPENCYFMMGDNRENSADSRYWLSPYVNISDMYAKVFLRYSAGRNGWYVEWQKPVDFYE